MIKAYLFAKKKHYLHCKLNKALSSPIAYSYTYNQYIINPNGILVQKLLGVRPAIHSQEVLATLDKLQNNLPTTEVN